MEKQQKRLIMSSLELDLYDQMVQDRYARQVSSMNQYVVGAIKFYLNNAPKPNSLA